MTTFLPYRTLQTLLAIGLLVGCVLSAGATHIVGGYLEMKALPAGAGHFRVTLTYYFNEQQTQEVPRPEILFVLFRKRDNQVMDSVAVGTDNVSQRPPIAFTNPGCATANQLKLGRVRYEKDIYLDPARYTDPAGYYLTNQTCCRNYAISNIQRIGQVGFAFYLEFPALQVNGKPFLNSSPSFGVPTGEVICIHAPFTTSAAAQDADGDELRYSLATPLKGYVTSRTNERLIRSAPYPTVQWQAGYSADNPILASQPLRLDARTGVLTVTATQEGLFVFTVRVEEYRAGRKIGEVRTDYQFLVADCQKTPLPEPVITADAPIVNDTLTLCPGAAVTLQTTSDPTLYYQWQRNDVNLTDATQPSLTVREPGDYAVIISKRDECRSATLSKKLTVKSADKTGRVALDSVAPICGTDGLPVTLRGIPVGGQFMGPGVTDNQFSPQSTGVGRFTIYYIVSRSACGADTARRTIVVTTCDQHPVWIPDAFSPNGDGLNDTWSIIGIERYPQARLVVFNRWGETVFSSEGSTLNAFDGRHRDQPLPDGAYTYTLILSPDQRPVRGRVLLLR